MSCTCGASPALGGNPYRHRTLALPYILLGIAAHRCTHPKPSPRAHAHSAAHLWRLSAADHAVLRAVCPGARVGRTGARSGPGGMQPPLTLLCRAHQRCLRDGNADVGACDSRRRSPCASDRPQDPVGAGRRCCCHPASPPPCPSPRLPFVPQAKPGLGKQQLAQILRAVGQQVMEHGGVVTDIRSYGERRLAYDIRQPGARYSEVGAAFELTEKCARRSVGACCPFPRLPHRLLPFDALHSPTRPSLPCRRPCGRATLRPRQPP